MLAELKQCFLEAYDDNNDGKIDIREVKTKNTFAFCLGYICTCCKKKLYQLLDTAAITFIHQRRVRAKKSSPHHSFTESEAAFFTTWDIAKSFFMHFLLFSLFLCILAAILAILLVNVFLVSLKKMSLRGEGKSYLQVCLSNIWLGCN